jgi:hypothetical protein
VTSKSSLLSSSLPIACYDIFITQGGVMKRIIIALLCLLTIFSLPTFAWTQSVSGGYGGGKDWNHNTDTNSGFLFSYDFYTLKAAQHYRFTLDASLGDWHSTYTTNKDLFTAALDLNIQWYVLGRPKYNPYFVISAGPGYLSHKKFGQNTQGSHFSFQSIVGAGMEMGKFDLRLNMVHFSNAGMFKPNEGFNIFYVVTLGYLFG